MAAVKISNLSTTWNTASVNYTGIKLNVIDTTSSVSSRLIDLQVASSSMFYVDKTGSVVATSFSGSLIGTASFTSFATSASYAPSSGGTTLVTGSTYPITSSWANNVVSSSFSTIAASATSAATANTASYVLNAVSASYATSSTSASFATVASSATNSTTANTASYVLNAVSASYATSSTSASFATSASYAPSSGGTTLVTGSTYPITSSWANNVVTASFSTSASYALSSSYATASTTASYALSASYVLDPLVGAPRNTSITGSGTYLYIDNWYVATSASFVLVASAQGVAPLYYQWFLNNTSSFLLQQSTQSFYSCSFATKENYSGSYLCNITNSLGSCTSVPYPLRVIDPVYISGSNGPSDTTPTINSTVDFHVTASGDELTYRWKRLDNSGVEYNTEDGTPSILNSGSVTPGLHIQAITSPTAEGRYFCRVTNPLGYLTSSKMLIYLSAPEIITQPYDISSSGVTHVEATGSDVRYEWQYGNSPILGQVTASLNVGDLMIAGTYTQDNINRGDKFRCRVYNDVGSVYSRDVSFRPFKIGFLEDGTEDKTQTNQVELDLDARSITQNSGSGPAWGNGNFRYDNNTSFTWYRDGNDVGADRNCWGDTTPILNLRNLQPSDQGQYLCSASHPSGSVHSDIITLTVSSATPDGFDSTYTYDVPLSSVWLYDTDSYLLKYTISFTSAGYTGNYGVVPEGYYRTSTAWRRTDFDTSSGYGVQEETLLVTGSDLPEWPYNTTTGYTSTKTVYGSNITGSFQIWKFQRVKFKRQSPNPIVAQTTTPWSSLNIDFTYSDAAEVDYLSSSLAASSDYATVTLYKMVNPTVTMHPSSSMTSSLGSATHISSSGTGSSIQYQWYKDGRRLIGKTSNVLSFGSVGYADAGSYYVAIGNKSSVSYKYVTSSTCVLYVTASI